MKTVLACIDGAPETASVCDAAGWAATRLSAPLEFLSVLDRHPERATTGDYSGAIGLDARDALLEELAAVDERRSVLAQQHARRVLDWAAERARAAGLAQVATRQRHGSLLDAVLELEPDVRLLVLGRRASLAPPGRLHLDHDVERIVRTVRRPVLVAASEFRPPQRFVIAFDGSATGRAMVATIAASPLLRGLACSLLTVGSETADTAAMQQARATLGAAGFDADTKVLAGEADTAILQGVQAAGAGLLVMGAYGHSRIRQLIVGSTTTTLLRTSPVPVLVMR